MAWVTPKTDWQRTDTFSLDPDYSRIRGNILHLKAVAATLYLPFSLAAMADYPIADFPFAEFFNAVDGNADMLLDETFRPTNTPRGKIYAAHKPVWNDNDLNRIERALLTLYQNLQAEANARPVLAFALGTRGGQEFGT